MGFFDGLGRLIQGKPVFEVGDQSTQVKQADLQQTSQPQSQQPAGPQTPPLVYVTRPEYQMSGETMELSLYIKNNSKQRVELDKLAILGTVYDLNRFLEPGEERECPVYSGPRPKNSYANKCNLNYKDPATSNFFTTHHIIDFKQEVDQTFTLYRITYVPPIEVHTNF